MPVVAAGGGVSAGSVRCHAPDASRIRRLADRDRHEPGAASFRPDIEGDHQTRILKSNKIPFLTSGRIPTTIV